MVYLQQDDEIGDDQWPEDQPGEPEIIEPDNNPQYGDDRMNIGHAFGQHETQHIIDTAKYNDPPQQNKYTLPGMVYDQQVDARRNGNETGAYDGYDRRKAGDHGPETRFVQAGDQEGDVGEQSQCCGDQRNTDGIAESLRLQFIPK